jgi:hypothetical protein
MMKRGSSSIAGSDTSNRQNERPEASLVGLVKSLTQQVTVGFLAVQNQLAIITNSIHSVEERLNAMEAQAAFGLHRPGPIDNHVMPFTYQTFEENVTAKLSEQTLGELVEAYAPFLGEMR